MTFHRGKGNFVTRGVCLSRGRTRIFTCCPCSNADGGKVTIPIRSGARASCLCKRTRAPTSVARGGIGVRVGRTLDRIMFGVQGSTDCGRKPKLVSTLGVRGGSTSGIFGAANAVSLDAKRVAKASASKMLTLVPNGRLLLASACRAIDDVYLPINTAIKGGVETIFAVSSHRFHCRFPINAA